MATPLGVSNSSNKSSQRTADARVSVVPDVLNQALIEFELMLRYVLSQGLTIDPPTLDAVLGVQQQLAAAEKVTVPPPEPQVPVAPETTFPPAPVDPVVSPPEPDFSRLLLTAHGGLAKLIAPATPLSLAATEPRGRFGYLSNPPLIKWMIVIALFSVIGFLITSIVIGNSPKP